MRALGGIGVAVVFAAWPGCSSGAGGSDPGDEVGSETHGDISDFEKLDDAGILTDSAPPQDIEPGETGETSEPDRVPAASYCERSVEMFCGYYVRCGRMAVDGLDECRRVFLETCNARYEPLYVDLEALGALSLSRGGLERCAGRLQEVACEAQIFDLDGCPDVWVGGVAVGGRCGPGLESFVCEEDAVCVLGLDFCGTCKALAGVGSCDLERRCRDEELCREGVCVARRAVGESCEAGGVSCVLGASCVDGVCRGPEVVGLGEACDQARRCPYRSQCVGGRCVRTELLGESCGGEVGCASGSCGGGVCGALGEDGAACTSGGACVSGRCEGERCAPIRWGCLGAP